MNRKLIIFLTAAVLLSVALSGCMLMIDVETIKAELQGVVNAFKDDIENYNIDEADGVLALLDPAQFTLRLEDQGMAVTKDYDLLKEELEADEDNQLAWRDDFGYELELRLTETVFDRIRRNSAYMMSRFYVYEEADGISPVITDSGYIIWNFAKVVGVWKISYMKISFDPVASDDRAVTIGDGDFGFGFGGGLEVD